jgi:hypothetical protein
MRPRRHWEYTMRSVIGRAVIPFGMLFVSSIESTAHAEATAITRNRAPWILLGGAYAGPRTDDVETRGRRIVMTHSQLASSSLVTSGVDRFGDGETIVRYAQSHRGLPVIGRGASVRLSATGQPIATVLDLESTLPARVDAVVTPLDAASVASSRMTIGASANDAHLVVWPTLDRGARLAWAVLPRVPAELPTRPRVIVDAETGEVLEVRDVVTFANAKVFQFNPTKTPNATTYPLPMPTDGVTLENPFLQASNCIDQKTVKPVNAFGFDMNLHVCELVHVAAPDTNGDYVYEPSDKAGSKEAREDAFSEVSMYFHASKAYAFFRALQGDEEAQVVADKPLRVIANLRVPAGLLTDDFAKAANPNIPLEPYRSAFFAPAGGNLGSLFQQLYGFEAGALWFGQGPKRDYAYDGDVVYHELTHAVVDTTLKLDVWHADARGAIDSPGAMNEALADYFSSAITGDPDVGEYAAVDFGANNGDPIRTLANEDRCRSLVGEVHADSTAFSGALWRGRTSLGEADRTKFDAALYKAMRSNPGAGNLGFEDLAKLFIATLKTDLPAGATALETSMTERGLLPACERIELYTGVVHRSRKTSIGFVAPGKSSVSVKGIAPGIFQLAAQFPEGTASMTVSFTARAGGSEDPGGSAKPFSPVVLAKLGAPITWDPKSKNGHDATFKVTPAEASGSVSATIEFPEATPAGTIYVQIANNGDADGSYDEVALSFTSPEDADTDAPAPIPQDSAVTTNESGCSTSSSKASSALFPGILVAVVASTALRRRHRSAS